MSRFPTAAARRHTGPVKLLDAFINGIYLNHLTSDNRLTYTFGPFSLAGSLTNVIVCSALVVGAVVIGFQQPGIGLFIPAAIGVVLLPVFIRVHVRARRGDFIIDGDETDESEETDSHD
jgi:hypothetical protein